MRNIKINTNTDSFKIYQIQDKFYSPMKLFKYRKKNFRL